MSQYTPAMESELAAQGSFTYAQAQSYAEKHGLSVRSVVSKIKSLGLEYERKPVTKSVTGKVETKAEMIVEIAAVLGVASGLIEGLAKADKASLEQLRAACKSLVK